MIEVSKAQAREAINRVAKTEDGKVLLAVLQYECGFLRNAMSIDDPNKTQVLASMRGVYGKIRKYIQSEALIDIEYKIKFVGDDHGKKEAD